MPTVRPFRALRYEVDAVGDLGLVTSPPYDVVGPEEQAALLARHPRNVIRLDLPAPEPGDAPEDRYRRAARTFAAWRSDGTFHKDPRPSLYVYEQVYAVPGSTGERTQRGFFGRLKLEPPGAGILPHERTLSAPREDRYRLLRATGANMSPVVGLHPDPAGRVGAILGRVSEGAAGKPVADVVDGDGVRHRMWLLPGDASPFDDSDQRPVDELVGIAGAGPITIADGHHRFETALRYRDERRMSRSCEEDPAFDYVLALLMSTDQPLTVLPTHRIVRDLADGGVSLLDDLGDLFTVTPVDSAARLTESASVDAEMAPGPGTLGGPGSRGRFGLWTRAGGAILDARPDAFAPLLVTAEPAVRQLDVVLLEVALAARAGIDQAAVGAGRIAYTRSAAEAIVDVEARRDGADAAFLLEPTPVADVVAVAAAGATMPQKSTYFFPKALSGLVINPHEW